ncbi:MAG: M48 family metallopeptidase [Candidatus Omnitrophota bacterium]|jgi:predicted Zn-dependent protease
MRIHKIIILIVILALAPFLTGGIMTFNPATEEEELIFVSTTKEKNMGRNIHKQVKKHYTEPADPLLQERIEKIGAKLAAVADRKTVVYRFTVLNDKKDKNYNAFAAPGGYIYIFDDLVEVMKTDDRIAAILAHEIGHVEAKHSIKRLQGSLGAQLLMILGSRMQTDQKSFRAVNAAVGQLMSAYSRHDERQADELSVRYLEKAGYDKRGALRALQTMKKLRKKAPRARYSYFRTHPYISERIAYLKKVIKGHMDFDTYINIVSEKDEL